MCTQSLSLLAKQGGISRWLFVDHLMVKSGCHVTLKVTYIACLVISIELLKGEGKGGEMEDERVRETQTEQENEKQSECVCVCVCERDWGFS